MVITLQQFEARCRSVYPALYQSVVRIVGDAHLAEDVLQEAFVKAWQAVVQLRDEERLEGWLYRIATRRAMEALRARQSWAQHTSVLDDQAASAAPNPLQAAEQAELERAVWRQLDALSPRQRAAFVLCAVEERQVREAAECLGISVGAVKRHLGRARKRLQQKLRRFVGGEACG